MFFLTNSKYFDVVAMSYKPLFESEGLGNQISHKRYLFIVGRVTPQQTVDAIGANYRLIVSN